jgi:hypothetical protein
MLAALMTAAGTAITRLTLVGLTFLPSRFGYLR